jgi:hypothetical protein
MIIHFVPLVTVVFTLGFVVWQRHPLINLAIKCFLLGLAIWGWYLIFHGVNQ